MIKERENTRQATTYNGHIAHVIYMCIIKKNTKTEYKSSLLSALDCLLHDLHPCFLCTFGDCEEDSWAMAARSM